jgi:SAM-dependent methyltransferase
MIADISAPARLAMNTQPTAALPSHAGRLDLPTFLSWPPATLDRALRKRPEARHFFAAPAGDDARHRALLDTLHAPVYGTAFEAGCVNGALTARLAQRCGRLLATDGAADAVRATRQYCAGLSNVDVRCAALSAVRFPRGPFDLIVFSELGCRFSATELAAIAVEVHRRLAPGGEFVAMHWLGDSDAPRLHGDDVHGILRENLRLRWAAGKRAGGFRIDTWLRPSH